MYDRNIVQSGPLILAIENCWITREKFLYSKIGDI